MPGRVYIGFAAIAGLVLDRWSACLAILVGITVICAYLALRAPSTGFAWPLLAVALLGVGGSFVSIGALKLVSEWLNGRECGTAVGVYTTGSIIGRLIALTATYPCVFPLVRGHWRFAFFAMRAPWNVLFLRA